MYILLLPLLFLGCESSGGDTNMSQEENVSQDINLSDCYSLNREQCYVSEECSIIETSEYILDDSSCFGGEFHIYDKTNFCIKYETLFIGCAYTNEDGWITNDSCDIDILKPTDRYIGDLDIYFNQTSNQYLAISKYGFGSYFGNMFPAWVKDDEVLNELVDYLNTNSYYFPRPCNTSKEIE
jgi:hypothetical protein